MQCRRLARLLPNDFLLIQDGLSRPPLQDWAKTIRRALEEQLTRKEKDLPRVASLINLTALVEVLRGDPLSARAVCEAELAWLTSLASQGYERTTISSLALQPWINIGRLVRMEGKMDEALRHFALVLKRPVHEPLLLGPYSITGEDWEQFLESDVLNTLWNIYIVESLKTYFKFREFKAALGFIAELRETKLDCWNNLMLEGEVISHAGLADYEAAYSVAKSRRTQEILDTLVFMLYEAFCLTALDRREEASPIARELTSFVNLGGLADFGAPTTMRYLERLGALLQTLAWDIDAARIYDRGYGVAVDADDQPFQISFLAAKGAQSGHEQSPEAKETRAALVGSCYYDKILRGEGFPGKRWVQAFGDLLAAVSIATDGALVLKTVDESHRTQYRGESTSANFEAN